MWQKSWNNRSKKQKQWLWFLGLWVLGLFSVLCVSYMIKWLMFLQM